jgi:hypothetical protein
LKLTHGKLLLTPTVFAVLCFATSVQAQVIRWAGKVDVGGDHAGILHVPDNRLIVPAPPAIVGDFDPQMRYRGLADQFGLSDRTLTRRCS